MAEVIKINEKDYEVGFTFNSFKHMEDLDISDLAEIDTKPFKVIKITEQLLKGALNHNPKVVFKEQAIDSIVEECATSGEIALVMGVLLELLQDSDFFKSLQAE